MEFSEIQELDVMVEYSQTFHQNGLIMMKQQLTNTPPRSKQNNKQFSSDFDSFTDTNPFYPQEKIYKQTIQNEANTEIILKQDQKNPQETIDDILNDIQNIEQDDQNTEEEQQNNNQIQQQINTPIKQTSQQSNSSSKKPIKQSSNASKQSKDTKSKKKNQQVEQEIAQVINTYIPQIPYQEDEEEDEDQDESDSESSLRQQNNNESKQQNVKNQEKLQQIINDQKNPQNQQDQQQLQDQFEDKDFDENNFMQNVTKSVFEKQNIDDVSIKKMQRSLFSQSISGTNKSVQGRKFNSLQNPNLRRIQVFFFSSPEYELTVAVLKTIKVKELIQAIIEAFLGREDWDQNRIRYRDFPQAYELRILDDEDHYEPDMSLPALNPDRDIKLCDFNQIAFIENPNFIPPAKQDKNSSVIHPSITKIESSKNKNNLLLQIKVSNSAQDSMTTVIPIGSHQILQDIFVPLQKKNPKFTSKDYIIQIKNQNGQDEELDPTVPIQYLQNLQIKQIELIKRNFADKPMEQKQVYQSFVQGLISEQYQTQRDQGIVLEDINNNAPLNIIQASKYEEFLVIKINKKGKRQQRILGIDQYKIFNLNKKVQDQKNIGVWEQLFAKNKNTGTKRPEILIENVMGIYIDQVDDSYFYMKVKMEESNKIIQKLYKYQVSDSKLARKIVDKILFLIQNQQ